jgi:hypothetical protein
MMTTFTVLLSGTEPRYHNTYSGTDERKIGSRWDKYSTCTRGFVIELSVDRGQGLSDCLIEAMYCTANTNVMGVAPEPLKQRSIRYIYITSHISCTGTTELNIDLNYTTM